MHERTPWFAIAWAFDVATAPLRARLRRLIFKLFCSYNFFCLMHWHIYRDVIELVWCTCNTFCSCLRQWFCFIVKGLLWHFCKYNWKKKDPHKKWKRCFVPFFYATCNDCLLKLPEKWRQNPQAIVRSLKHTHSTVTCTNSAAAQQTRNPIVIIL